MVPEPGRVLFQDYVSTTNRDRLSVVCRKAILHCHAQLQSSNWNPMQAGADATQNQNLDADLRRRRQLQAPGKCRRRRILAVNFLDTRFANPDEPAGRRTGNGALLRWFCFLYRGFCSLGLGGSLFGCLFVSFPGNGLNAGGFLLLFGGHGAALSRLEFGFKRICG